MRSQRFTVVKKFNYLFIKRALLRDSVLQPVYEKISRKLWTDLEEALSDVIRYEAPFNYDR
jgi:hypothetical protein